MIPDHCWREYSLASTHRSGIAFALQFYTTTNPLDRLSPLPFLNPRILVMFRSHSKPYFRLISTSNSLNCCRRSSNCCHSAKNLQNLVDHHSSLQTKIAEVWGSSTSHSRCRCCVLKISKDFCSPECPQKSSCAGITAVSQTRFRCPNERQ